MPHVKFPGADQFDDESECDDMHATAMSSTSTSIQPATGETASTGNRAGGVNPAPATHQDNVNDDVGGFRMFMNQCMHAPGTMPGSSTVPGWHNEERDHGGDCEYLDSPEADINCVGGGSLSEHTDRAGLSLPPSLDSGDGDDDDVYDHGCSSFLR